MRTYGSGQPPTDPRASIVLHRTKWAPGLIPGVDTGVSGGRVDLWVESKSFVLLAVIFDYLGLEERSIGGVEL